MTVALNSLWVQRTNTVFSGANSTTAATSLSVNAGGNFATPQIGDLLVVPFSSSVGALSTVTDSKGNQWNIVQTQNGAGGIFCGFAWTILTVQYTISTDNMSWTFAVNGNRTAGACVNFQPPPGPITATSSVGADETATKTVDLGLGSLLLDQGNELVIAINVTDATSGGYGLIDPAPSISAGASLVAGTQIETLAWFEQPAGFLTFVTPPTAVNVVDSKGISLAFKPGAYKGWKNPGGGSSSVLPWNGSNSANGSTTLTTSVSTTRNAYAQAQPGNLGIIVAASAAGVVSSVVDTSGNAWDVSTNTHNAANTIFLTVAWCIIAAPYRPSDTLTWNFAAGGARFLSSLTNQLFRPPNGPITLDTSAVGADQGATTTIDPGTITATSDHELIVAVFAATATLSTPTFANTPDILNVKATAVGGLGTAIVAWNNFTGAFHPTGTVGSNTSKGMILAFKSYQPNVSLA